MSPHKSSSQIKWTASAWGDLEGIAEYLLSQSESHEDVENFLQRITNAPKHLVQFPGAGKPGRMTGTREWRIQSTPYALVYATRDGFVYILRVMHDSRRFPKQ